MLYENPNDFDNGRVQFFITTSKLFNLKKAESFQKLWQACPRLKVEGFLPQKDDTAWRSDYFYKQDRASVVIDSESHLIEFEDSNKCRTAFLIDDETMSITSVQMLLVKLVNPGGEMKTRRYHRSDLMSKQDFSDPQYSEHPFKQIVNPSTTAPAASFSFVIAVQMPEVDVFYAKMMSDV